MTHVVRLQSQDAPGCSHTIRRPYCCSTTFFYSLPTLILLEAPWSIEFALACSLEPALSMTFCYLHRMYARLPSRLCYASAFSFKADVAWPDWRQMPPNPSFNAVGACTHRPKQTRVVACWSEKHLCRKKTNFQEGGPSANAVLGSEGGVPHLRSKTTKLIPTEFQPGSLWLCLPKCQ